MITSYDYAIPSSGPIVVVADDNKFNRDQPLRHTSVLLSLQLPLVSGRLILVTVSPTEWKAHSSHLSSPLFLLVDLVDPVGTEAPSPVVLVFVPSCYLSTMSAPHVLTFIKRCV